MVENLQREDLNPVEEALGYRTLMQEYSMTQEGAANVVGKSRPVIANALRLLALPEKVLDMLRDGKISVSHARLLLELDGDAVREKAAEEIIEKSLTVRQTEALIKKIKSGKKPKKEKPEGVDYMAEVEKDLTKSLGRKVKVVSGKRKGRIEIEYYGNDDFEVIREALMALKAGGKKN